MHDVAVAVGPLEMLALAKLELLDNQKRKGFRLFRRQSQAVLTRDEEGLFGPVGHTMNHLLDGLLVELFPFRQERNSPTHQHLGAVLHLDFRRQEAPAVVLVRGGNVVRQRELVLVLLHQLRHQGQRGVRPMHQIAVNGQTPSLAHITGFSDFLTNDGTNVDIYAKISMRVLRFTAVNKAFLTIIDYIHGKLCSKVD